MVINYHNFYICTSIFSNDNEPKSITYTKFLEYVNEGNVQNAEIIGRTFTGNFKTPVIFENEVTDKSKEYKKFTTILPEVSVDLTKQWDKHNIDYEFKEQSFGLTEYLIQFSPWLLIIVFWFFL